MAGAALAGPLRAADSDTDPFLWLEDISSPRALAWVKAQNDATQRRLTADHHYKGLYRDALEVLNAKSRPPEVEQHGAWVYNFWRDAAHPRGIWRRVAADALAQANPRWQTVLDVDALAQSDRTPWSFSGSTWRHGDDRRCLIRLSPAGGDAAAVREFDVEAKRFVAGGFELPTAKSRVSWRDADTLFVGTDFGPGTMTTSGYPAQVRLWRRGTPLLAATLVYAGDVKHVGATARRLHSNGGDFDVVTEGITAWTQKAFLLQGGRLVPLELPPTARIVDALDGKLVIRLRDPWIRGDQHFDAGAVLVADPSGLAVAGVADPGGRAQRAGPASVEEVVTPSPDLVVGEDGAKGALDVVATADGLWVNALDHVRGRLFHYQRASSGWTRKTVELPDNGAVTLEDVDDATGTAWVSYESFLIPPSLYRVAESSLQADVQKTQQPSFDAAPFAVRQFEATSDDGTQVPYFVVGPKVLTGKTWPVWMFSYGGFEVSLTPAYSGSYEELHGAYGKLWLQRGGVFVLANIRGGGEFGPAWHEAAVGIHHVRAFEDFEAVAKDLVARGITTPKQLGIEGRSNGGLLVLATMLRHPELYGAVVCGNPLVDMKRYSHLLAGASWMGEYGDPDDPNQWAFISQYSPYHRVHPGMKLPPILFYTTTHDDRVHPGHARKMAAKMEAMGYPVYYCENTEGGHHGAVTNEELATRLAQTYTFLWQKLSSR